MARVKRKKFEVQKRFEVWMAVEISATDFDDAVAQSKELKLDDFLVPACGASCMDYTLLPGTGVIESW